MTIKNLWSLNVDEVITAQKIKSELGKEYASNQFKPDGVVCCKEIFGGYN